jgi:chorismate mutase
VVAEHRYLALSQLFRQCAVGLCALTALAVMPTTTPARGDDANPLLELVDAATQRLQTAEPVAASKWLNGGSLSRLPPHA